MCCATGLGRTSTNQRWSAKYTSVWATEGWLYVAVVLDLLSRRMVGWSMKAQMTAERVTDALLMALWRRDRTDELKHHSDQNSRYSSSKFQRLLNARGIECSMSRRGDCRDNERFYNLRRRHSTLGYPSPVEYEKQAESA